MRKRRSNLAHLLPAGIAITLLLLLVSEQALSRSVGDAHAQNLVTFSHPVGHYDAALSVHLNSRHPEAAIIFTTDGSTPTPQNSTRYHKPIFLSATPPTAAVISARALLPDGSLGPVASASYLVGIESTLPVISLLVAPDDLWSKTNGLFEFPGEKGTDWERPVQVFYLDSDGQAGFQIPAGLRIHGQSSRFEDKKSLRLYFRQEYGASRLAYPLFPESDVASFKRLVLHAGGQDFPAYASSGTLLRNDLTAALSRETDAYAPHSRPVLLFINGQAWGIYSLRERIDRHFLYDHYGIDSPDIIGGFQDALRIRPLEGSLTSWEHLVGYLETHDLQDPAHYATVQSQVDLAHFIDYLILQIYIANGDWPHNNQTKFYANGQGGRWHWIFWDTDFSFGLGPRSSIDRDMVQHLLQFEDEAVERGTILFQKLIRNPDFRTRFISRTADLLNTTLTYEQVVAEIDRLAGEVAPNIAFETRRWPGSGDWDESVAYMRTFAQQRPDWVRQHMVEGLQLDGTFTLQFEPPTAGQGTITVNDHEVAALSWQGVYFAGTAVTLRAVPQSGYQFAGWEPASLPQTAVITLTDAVNQPITPRFVKADQAAPQPDDVRIIRAGHDGMTTPDGQAVSGDWIELRVMRSGGVDVRGWRLTDNDTLTAVDEGSLIFGDVDALAAVRGGTTITIVAAETAVHDAAFPEDDLDDRDGQMLIYVGNGHIDTVTDPWFNLGPADNVMLLAPGKTAALVDDQEIDRVRLDTLNQ